jgi:hypothetical protein
MRVLAKQTKQTEAYQAGQTFSRRKFLYRAATLSAAAVALPLVPVATTQAASPIGKYLITGLGWFANNILAPVVADVAAYWLTHGSTPKTDAGNAAAADKQPDGYTDVGSSPVFETYEMPFFGITNSAGSNTYVPFLFPNGAGYSYTFLGGPAIIGLERFSYDLRNAFPQVAPSVFGEWLLPRWYAEATHPYYPFDNEWRVSYPTLHGSVGMLYRYNYNLQRWEIGINAFDTHGQPQVADQFYAL